MFSLIISIISIALVAALAAATVYFGGAAFNKGGAGADASAFINAAQQIAGAYTLAATDGDNATTLAQLSDGTGEVYLAQIPTYKGASLVESTNHVVVGVTDSVCVEIAKKVTPAVDTVGELTSTGTIPAGLFGCAKANAADALMTGSASGQSIAFYKVK